MSGSVLPALLLYHFTQQQARCWTWPWWGWLAWPFNVIALFIACSHDEFHGFFTTAAMLSALGGMWPWHWVRKNAGVERDPWTWGWKLPFLPFPFSFFTAAGFLALGGSNLDLKCEQRRRAWPVNLTVKAPFPPFPILFLHSCCVLGARVYVTLTLTANGGVDARCRAWPVNLMVKAPFPPFPVLFLHGCCVLGARGNVTLLGGTWPWPWVRTAASTP